MTLVAILLAGGGALILNLSLRSETDRAVSTCPGARLSTTGPRGGTAPRIVFRAATHPGVLVDVPCGVDLLAPCVPFVDFDGSLWTPRGGWSFSGPAEPATVKLVGRDSAILTTFSGDTLLLRRHSGPLRVPGCPAPLP